MDRHRDGLRLSFIVEVPAYCSWAFPIIHINKTLLGSTMMGSVNKNV